MYEEYMQNLLGVQPNPYRNTYEQLDTGVIDLESLYPEIYKIIYPMVRRACVQNTRPITQDLVDEMTREIYNNVETDNLINVNVSLDSKEESENSTIETAQVQNRQMNTGLSDLIKILVLRELIGKSGRVNSMRSNFSGMWRL